jgi:AcrR family transcriptional regulator
MPTTGLRERKKLQTRQALRNAALQLTVERGLDHVTVEDIAAMADVSPRTFFNYFSSKEVAVVGGDPELMIHVLGVLAARPVEEEPLLSLHAVLEEFATLLVQNRDVHVLRRKVLAENPGLLSRRAAAFDEFERVLIEGVRERMTPGTTSDADPALVVAVAVAAMKVSVEQWVASEGDTDLHALLQSAINRLAIGFGPASARPVAPTRGSGRKTIRKDLR